MKKPRAPRRWRLTELARECEKSSSLFRRARSKEPLEQWVNSVREQEKVFSKLLDVLSLSGKYSSTSIDAVSFNDPAMLVALRYVAAPPISQDDLKILSGAEKDWKTIGKNNKALSRILKVIYRTLDPIRFPWRAANRKPTSAELRTAIISSSLLLTAQKIATNRRNLSKSDQEAFVKRVLSKAGFTEVPSRAIKVISDAPTPGQFCGEAKLGSRKADIVVRLLDGRLLAIECKVSNSALNSVKRVNNDAAVKAGVWLKEFGTAQVIPSAVLAGVFGPAKLDDAQDAGLSLFWSHRLEELVRFARLR